VRNLPNEEKVKEITEKELREIVDILIITEEAED